MVRGFAEPAVSNGRELGLEKPLQLKQASRTAGAGPDLQSIFLSPATQATINLAQPGKTGDDPSTGTCKVLEGRQCILTLALAGSQSYDM